MTRINKQLTIILIVVSVLIAMTIYCFLTAPVSLQRINCPSCLPEGAVCLIACDPTEVRNYTWFDISSTVTLLAIIGSVVVWSKDRKLLKLK